MHLKRETAQCKKMLSGQKPRSSLVWNVEIHILSSELSNMVSSTVNTPLLLLHFLCCYTSIIYFQKSKILKNHLRCKPASFYGFGLNVNKKRMQKIFISIWTSNFKATSIISFQVDYPIIERFATKQKQTETELWKEATEQTNPTNI